MSLNNNNNNQKGEKVTLEYQTEEEINDNNNATTTTTSNQFNVYVNGKHVSQELAKQAYPTQTLLQFIRNVLQLTGSKLGCAEGGCGACTVMISKWDPTNSQIQHYSVNACLFPVLSAHNCHVTTVEGVGQVQSTSTLFHPIQDQMTQLHGSQCGYCTPGIIVSMYAILANSTATATINTTTTTTTTTASALENFQEHLDGNLCRCTGYRPIWDAAKTLSYSLAEKDIGPCSGSSGDDSKCDSCPDKDTPACSMHNAKDMEDLIISTSTNDKIKQASSSSSSSNRDDNGMKMMIRMADFKDQPNRMFPNELKETTTNTKTTTATTTLSNSLLVSKNDTTWFQPSSIQQLLQFKQKYPNCKFIVGNTEVGIETRFKHAKYNPIVVPNQNTMPSLYQWNISNDTITIGSCLSLSQIQKHCLAVVGLSSSKDVKASNATTTTTTIVTCIHDMLRFFASTQIRNVACLGGNLITASPISDMNPVLASLGASVTLVQVKNDTTTNNNNNDNSNEEKTIVRRSVKVSELFVGYRRTVLEPTELVECITIPTTYPKDNNIIDESSLLVFVIPFKQARRREDDISIVTAGTKLVLQKLNQESDNNSSSPRYIIHDICIAFGGMAPTTILATKTMEALLEKDFTQDLFYTVATTTTLQELALPETVPGGQAAFRMALASSFVFKLYLQVAQQLQVPVESTTNFLQEPKPDIVGTQTYPKPKVATGVEGPVSQSKNDENSNTQDLAAKDASTAVGKATPHASGALHCTGQAIYTDDIPLPPGTLHGSLILSKECGRVYTGMDTDAAIQLPGVFGIYTAHEIENVLHGKNVLGPIVKDEVVFLPIGEKVRTVGQVLGICVAETLDQAELAAQIVSVTYAPNNDDQDTDKSPIIVTIEDAIKHHSFYESTRHVLERGDIDDSLPSKNNDDTHDDLVTVSGIFRSGAQEHFYLETNCTLVVPSEENDLTVYCSTQAATKTQTFCASTTNTPACKVVVRVKRLGGGFGGKETRNVFASCAAAIAAKISRHPVKLTLPRDIDMAITGTRHAFVTKYKACANKKTGKLHAMDIKLYNNGGWGLDLSGPVADRALFHIDNVYFCPNLRAEAVVCKTVQAPNTAFRGFGGPQGMAANEHIMEHLADACGIPIDTFRRNNIYQDGESTHFGMVLGESGKWNVPTMWDRMVEQLQVPKRRAEIDAFNQQHKWIKRGLAVLPTKFGIAFTAKYMNQGGALVHLYTDGTVLVSHGGTEMGQGLHTKVCQVAAQAFGIPVEKVYVNDSSTDKVANTIPTAASMSTDLYGMATLDACRQILARLVPIREKLGNDATLAQVANTAFMERIDLSAHGFYTLDGSRCGYDWFKPKPEDYPTDSPPNRWKGHPFNYFTQGVAVTEVEIDVLSGNHKTIRSDVLVDVGSSINPAIDIGQIEGAFTQGMGWSTIEEVIFADDDHTWIRPRGKMFTTGPGTYKIPAFNDVPEIFNVSLLENVDNPFAVHSSKAIGEPPFFLGSSVFYAIKDAIKAARNYKNDNYNENNENYFQMDMPGSSERIRLLCNDEIAAKAISKMIGNSEAGSMLSYIPGGTF